MPRVERTRSRHTGRHLLPSLLALALTLACGGDATGDGDTQVVPAGGPTARASGGLTGTFDLNGASHAFRVVHCDLSGDRPGGVLLRGAGTAPDGRPLSVVVTREATRSGSMQWESATLYFGSITEGDMWTTRRGHLASGSWVPGEPGDPAEGPLIRVAGNELVVEGVMHHETRDATQPGVLRVTCG